MTIDSDQARCQSPRSPFRRRHCWVLARVLFCGVVSWLVENSVYGEQPSQAAPVDYLRQVKPLLKSRCYACHGVLKQESGLRLDSSEFIRRGGESGPAIAPGKSQSSLLISAITGTNDVTLMPQEGKRLEPEQVALLRDWIDQGAVAPPDLPPPDPRDHWAFRPPIRPPIPDGAGLGRSLNPIDAFVDRTIQQQGLRPLPPAPPHVLLRRVYIDLVGIPPSRDELRAFLSDREEGAYERAVDRLLASPQYGERWARHWMDVWRYSDWDGWQAEIRESQPHLWRWRDWIIESLNSDQPYDRMVREMIAGDELAGDDPNIVRATGYLARNWFKFNRNTWLDNTVEHTGKAFLGVTLNCARCHDHKYDPILQEEYYRFRAIFEPHQVRVERLPGVQDTNHTGLARVFDADSGAPTFLFKRGNENQPDRERPLAPAAPAILGGTTLAIAPVTLPQAAVYPGGRDFVHAEARAQAKTDLEAARRELHELTSARPRSESDGKEKPQTNRDASPMRANDGSPITFAAAAMKLAIAEQASRIIEARILADKALIDQSADATNLAKAAHTEEARLAYMKAEQALADAEANVNRLRTAKNSEPDGHKPDPAAAEKTGKELADAEKKLDESLKARDAAREAVGQPKEQFTRFSEVYPSTSTGRRLALARWITDRSNPLAARVAVNHIWLRHFNNPLVPTVFDFGLNGQHPSHPELLDWLAVEFMESGWSMKHLHRLMVSSRVYQRMSSAVGSDAEFNAGKDPSNRLLWRMNPRRLEAEAVRDSTLAVAGQLDRTMYGADLDPELGMTSGRRSIYFRTSKEKGMSFLSLFDSANVTDCYRRSVSVVPQQALAMANSPLTLAQSRALAKAISNDDKIASGLEFIDEAFWRILCRAPTSEERRECEAFLVEQATLLGQTDGLTSFGSSPAGMPPAGEPSLRARESLIHVLLNHNDFLTVR